MCTGRFPFFLKCVFTSKIDFTLNLVPVYTTVSKNIVSVSDISAVKDSFSRFGAKL